MVLNMFADVNWKQKVIHEFSAMSCANKSNRIHYSKGKTEQPPQNVAGQVGRSCVFLNKD